MNDSDGKRRWGLILAGGDGVRLRPLTRFISRDERPKQFCPLYNGATLLEQARGRAQRAISPNQILYSLNRQHENFYLHSLADCPAQRIVQPRNRGTAPAILSGLRLIADRDKDATIAVLPSDHYFSNDARFVESLENAFELANRYPEFVVVLGATPDRPETGYGWIQPGTALAAATGTSLVHGFEEKPCQLLAQSFWEQGYLWNTFIMVGKIRPFLEMIGLAVPGLLEMFRKWRWRQAPGEEIRIADGIYDSMPSLDFSRRILTENPSRLMVHRLENVYWNDLGDCDRAVAALSDLHNPPEWIGPWRAEAQRAACA